MRTAERIAKTVMAAIEQNGRINRDDLVAAIEKEMARPTTHSEIQRAKAQQRAEMVLREDRLMRDALQNMKEGVKLGEKAKIRREQADKNI